MTGHGGSGPGHHLVELTVSDTFFDDGEGRIERAYAEFDDRQGALAEALQALWGPPEHHERGPSVPSTMWAAYHLTCAGELDVWQRHDRTVLIGVSHEDKELPLTLFAAILAD
jgi:hypothetical protein